MHFPKIKILIGYKIFFVNDNNAQIYPTSIFSKHQSKSDAIQSAIDHMISFGTKVSDYKISVKRQINIELTF
jgi:hypothetical protein